MNKLDKKSSYKSLLESMSFDSRINSLISIKSFTSNIENANEDQIFPVFLSCIKKTIRSPKEDNIIFFYLSKLTEFVQLMKASSNDNFKELISIISSKITHSFLPSNKLLFRYGDKGDKYYIVLKGKLNIIVPKDLTMMLSEEEYFDYLQKLKTNNENALLIKVIQANEAIFPILDKTKNRRNSRNSIFFQRENSLAEKLKMIDYKDSMNYIECLKPIVNKELFAIRKELKVWVYFNVLSISTGYYFGDAAIVSHDQMRTATIIAEDDCHLGIINKDVFEKYVREANENKKYANINFLLSTSILSDVGHKYFKLHYLNFFVNTNLVIYDKIIIEGQSPTNIFFIKEGEFEISFKKSIVEINDLINDLGGKNQDEIDEEKSKMSESPKFSKFMSEKKLYRVNSIFI